MKVYIENYKMPNNFIRYKEQEKNIRIPLYSLQKVVLVKAID